MRLTLGLMALVCFVVHAAGCCWRGVPGDALWACHVAVAVMGLGLMSRSSHWAGAGCLWILCGTPLWLLDVLGGAEFVPTSLATHGGGFVIALLAVRKGGLARGSWWRAELSGAALQQVTRWVTDSTRNVNAAFDVYDRFRNVFDSYSQYLLALGVIVAICLWCGEFTVRKLCSTSASATEFWSQEDRDDIRR